MHWFFKMSFCVRTQIAVNKVVIALKHIVSIWIVLLFSIILVDKSRLIRKLPATTMVLKWSKTETGVGPSVADSSHEWRPNWADLTVAARRSLINGRMSGLGFNMKMCWNSHVFKYNKNHATDNRNAISPIWLYKIACSAAVFTSSSIIIW